MWSVAGVLSHLGPNSTGAMYWTLARVPKPARVGFLLPPLDLGSPAEVTRACVSFCSPKWLLNSLFSFNCIQQQAWGLKNSCMFCENTQLIRRVKSFCLGKGLSVCSLGTREHTRKSPGQSYPVTATRKTAQETQIQGTALGTASFFPFSYLLLTSLASAVLAVAFLDAVMWSAVTEHWPGIKMWSVSLSAAGKSRFSRSAYSFFQAVEASGTGRVSSLQMTPCC